MITFLIKSIICLALLLTFYQVFLERQNMPRFNRYYLLGILLFSLVIPNAFINLESPIVSPINALSEVTINSFQLSDYMNYIIAVYLVVMVVFLLKFIFNLLTITKIIRQNEQFQDGRAIFVLMDEKVLPHTFLNYIFLNKEDYLSNKIEDELFTHELAHAKQRHTLDILFVELFQIVFWFNPVLYYVKKCIRLNHEYIADESVISRYNNTVQYQHILLDVASWSNGNCLSSNLNYALTKKRFQMMVKRSSPLSKRIAKLSIVPLLLVFVFLFANNINSGENYSYEHRDENNPTVLKGEHSNREGQKNEHGESGEHSNKERSQKHND